MCLTDQPLKKDAAMVQQEMAQGWEHMPCGVHANPWRAAIVVKLDVAALTPCAYNGGRTLPTIHAVASIGPMPPA